MSGEQKVLQGTAVIAANGRVDRGVRAQGGVNGNMVFVVQRQQS